MWLNQAEVGVYLAALKLDDPRAIKKKVNSDSAKAVDAVHLTGTSMDGSWNTKLTQDRLLTWEYSNIPPHSFKKSIGRSLLSFVSQGDITVGYLLKNGD